MNFDAKQLKRISILCRYGEIPLSVHTVRRLCRAGKFPAIKQGNEWFTSDAAIAQFFYRRGNAAFRRIAA